MLGLQQAHRPAFALQADKDAVRDAQRAAVAGILATMEQHFAAGAKRPQSPSPQPAAKRSKLRDLGDMDFGSNASSDDESDSDYFESLVLGGNQPAEAGAAEPGVSPASGHPSSSAQSEPGPSDQAAASGVTASEGPQSERPAPVQPAAAEPAEPISLGPYDTPKALEALGLDALKAQLQLHRLKCGGTLSDRAARLFLLKDTPRSQLSTKHFAPPARK